MQGRLDDTPRTQRHPDDSWLHDRCLRSGLSIRQRRSVQAASFESGGLRLEPIINGQEHDTGLSPRCGHNKIQIGTKCHFKRTLVREGHVAWIYLTPELEQVLGQNEGTAFAVPNEWIQLLGDEDQGWVVLRTKEFETCFHGPSVSSLNF